jgi:hypothetical protein
MKSNLRFPRILAPILTVGLLFTEPRAPAQTTALLRLHTISVAPGAPTEFEFIDQGTGSTNYTVEFSPAVGAGAGWTAVPGAVVTTLGSGNFRVLTPPVATSPGFYRVRGNGGGVIASFATTAFQVMEGGTVAAVINFNAPFVGTIRYTVSGTAGSGDFAPLSGTVFVNGSSAIIPVALTENASINEIRNLTLRLESGPGYRVGTTSRSTITIDENDADWQGSFVTGKGRIGFLLNIRRSLLGDQATLRSDGFGFFPTNEIPASLTFTGSNFLATVSEIPMMADATLLNSALSLRLMLNAANGQTNQSVSPTLVQGDATLITTVPGRDYLNHTNRGTFVLLKSPVRPSTNEVELVSQP